MVALGNMNTWHPLLESVGDAVCLVDIDRSVLKCNSSMASFLRKETDEIVGHKCHDVMCCGARAAGECDRAGEKEWPQGRENRQERRQDFQGISRTDLR